MASARPRQSAFGRGRFEVGLDDEDTRALMGDDDALTAATLAAMERERDAMLTTDEDDEPGFEPDFEDDLDEPGVADDDD